jgi:GDP-L-fucose synthase
MNNGAATALVTGGAGFVGRQFVRRLLEYDYHVTVVDNLSSGLPCERWPERFAVPPCDEPRLRFCHADARDYFREASADFELIIHLAAVVGGRLTIEGDPLAVATDLSIDAEFFNWLARSPTRPGKIVYFSSSAAYPIRFQTENCFRTLSEDLISFEDQLHMPDMTYGWSKLSGEFLARYAASAYELDVVTYRPFSGYGETQDFTYPFPSIVRRVASGESPIVVWGSGRQQRDFIYIDDVVSAVFATMGQLQPGDALNLGSGQGTTFFELAALVMQ